MTYTEFISQFPVFDNPPKKKGYHRHHIVPVAKQTETDNRQIYLTWPQHFWAHILYDREHGTKTATRFLNLCGKTSDFFDCYEKCLAYSYTYRKKKLLASQKRSTTMKEIWTNQERKDKQSKAYSGEGNPMYGRRGERSPLHNKHWFNNGSIEIYAHECPEGYTIGRLTQGTQWWNNGTIDKMSKTCPGPEFVLGRLNNKRPRLSQNV